MSNLNEEQPKVTPLSLRRILTKIETIGNAEFNGETRENIKTIYDRLTTREKRLLLQVFLDMSSMLSMQFAEDGTVSVNRTTTDMEIDEIEIHNAKELASFKIWFAKAIFVLVSVGFVVVSSVLYFLDPSTSVMSERVKTLLQIWKTVTG